MQFSEEDDETIKSALLGDPSSQSQAIKQLYEIYAGMLTGYVVSLAKVKVEEHVVSTSVNSVFIKLAKKCRNGKFLRSGSIRSLLYKMTRDSFKDEMRKKGRWDKKHLSVSPIGEEPAASDNDSTGGGTDPLSEHALNSVDSPGYVPQLLTAEKVNEPSRILSAKEVCSEFGSWIESLPPLQRQVAEQMKNNFGQITDAEIAENISNNGNQCPVSSVKSARAQIRQKFLAQKSSILREYRT